MVETNQIICAHIYVWSFLIEGKGVVIEKKNYFVSSERKYALKFKIPIFFTIFDIRYDNEFSTLYMQDHAISELVMFRVKVHVTLMVTHFSFVYNT